MEHEDVSQGTRAQISLQRQIGRDLDADGGLKAFREWALSLFTLSCGALSYEWSDG